MPRAPVLPTRSIKPGVEARPVRTVMSKQPLYETDVDMDPKPVPTGDDTPPDGGIDRPPQPPGGGIETPTDPPEPGLQF
jgi:hypothetical protein